ncbi:MAG: hypothetical protein V1754_00955 [Pseudomonadota bacterium]
MSFDNADFDDDLDTGESPPEESSNRLFLIIAGVLGGIAILTLICIAAYAFFYLPRIRQAQESNKATVDAQNTQVDSIINQTKTAAAIEAYTDTPTNTPIPPTASATLRPTQVVAVATTVSPLTTLPAETATYMALAQTLDAIRKTSTTSPQVSGTPKLTDTGFADEVGLPVMLGAAVLLIVVIVIARRLRTV